MYIHNYRFCDSQMLKKMSVVKCGDISCVDLCQMSATNLETF
jgi:hypothetical protein